jgi:protein-serine/threonine kinase
MEQRIPLEVAVLHEIGMHPNIVGLNSFFQDEFFCYMVSDYKIAMDLFDYLERSASIPEDQMKDIFMQTTNAVHHIHSLGIVHLDIKDENVLIGENHHVWLIDFGSAQYTRNGPFTKYYGTSLYEPPEILRGEEYRGKEQDVWQLGVLLYILMYRKNPFVSEYEIMACDYEAQNYYSLELLELLRSILTLDPNSRLTTAQILNHACTK